MNDNEWTPSERAALVTWLLVRGRTLTPADVATLTQCKLRAGYYVLERLSRVVPLVEDHGRWTLIQERPFIRFDSDL